MGATATHTNSHVHQQRHEAVRVDQSTGTSATTFAPNGGVTRGQNVMFAKCYDDNIVQPALDADISTNATGITASASAVAGLDTAMPFAVTYALRGPDETRFDTSTAFVDVVGAGETVRVSEDSVTDVPDWITEPQLTCSLLDIDEFG